MVTPNIFGAYDSRDLPAISIGNGATEAEVLASIQRWALYFERAVEIYASALSSNTIEATGNEGVGIADGEMQPYGEYSNTEGTRTDSNEWSWGAPIRRYRDMQIYTEEYLAVANLQTIAKDTVAATNRYLTTRLKSMLRALMRNTSYTFRDKDFPGQGRGNLTVYPLFNADGTEASIVVNNASVSAGTIQSYLPSGVAGFTKTNFTIARSALRDRGLTGRIVHVVSPTNADAVRAMTGFIPVITEGAYARTTPAAETTTPIVSAPEAIGTFADGTADGEVVVWPFFPAGYSFSYDANNGPPLVFRQHEMAQFQGFRLVQNDTGASYGEAALRNKTWEWIGGNAVANRINGVAVKGTDGAYTIPAI